MRLLVFICLFTHAARLHVACCNAACRSAGELFHAAHNKIRPTPCSLLSGFYRSNRLVQVISFLWRPVMAMVRSEHDHVSSC